MLFSVIQLYTVVLSCWFSLLGSQLVMKFHSLDIGLVLLRLCKSSVFSPFSLLPLLQTVFLLCCVDSFCLAKLFGLLESTFIC